MICLIAYHQLYPLFTLMIPSALKLRISTIDDSRLMQSDLDSISQWSSDTELFFNESKFAHICFWSKPSFIDLPEYNINSKTISKVVKIKDLGIILSSYLNWDYHY